MILSQVLAANLSKGPTRIALKYLDKDVMFKDLLVTVSRFSYMFNKEIGKNARVAFIGSNSPAFVSAFFALTNNRSIVIPIDPNLSDDDIGEWVYETRPTHIMVTNDFVARVRDLMRRRGISAQLIEIEKKQGGEYATSFVPPADHTPTDKDPILLLRTAGTAGRYKYALFSHLQVQAAVAGLKKPYRVGPTDRFLTTMSWAHPFSFMHGMVFPVLSGSTCVIDHGLELDQFLTFLTQSKVTRLVGFPAFFERLHLLCRSFERNLICKSLTVSMGTLSEDVVQGFTQMKVKVATCYGQTENLWSISMTDCGEEADGRPIGLAGYKYKVLDDNGDAIETDEARSGQLAVTGGAVMMRYEPRIDKPEEHEKAKKDTQSALRGTWLYTGDVFEMEGDGDEVKMSFASRKDGFNPVPKSVDGFNPTALDKAFRRQDGVTDFASTQIGVGKGPIVCVVVLKDGVAYSEHQLVEQTKSALTPKNVPSVLYFLKEIPRTPDGKVDTAAIEKMYTDAQEALKKKAS